MEHKQKKWYRDVSAYLFAFLRRGLQQDSVPVVALTQEDFADLMNLSRRHEVQSLAAHGLLLSGRVTDEQEAQCRQIVYKTMVYQQRWSRVLAKTCSLLEEAGIVYMPLKGAVIHSLYPEPWLRTSADIDILVRDVDRAIEVLTENGYTHKKVGSHDVTVISPNGIPIEVHFQLIETNPCVNALLERVWEYASPLEGSCCFRMDPEMLYFYHIAHMAKHMVVGGCGIRYFADIWLFNQKLSMDEAKKNQLLQEGGLTVFGRQAERLCQLWFGDFRRDPLLEELEQFVLNGGIFGSPSNALKILRSKSDSSAGTVFLRIFKPYSRMMLQYPILKKYPILLPVFWIRRWITLLLKKGKVRSAVRELKLNQNLDRESVSVTKQLFEKLELH